MVTVTSRTPVSSVAGLTCCCHRNRGSLSNCPRVLPALTPSTPSIMANRSPASRTAVSRSAAPADAWAIAPSVRTPALIPIASTAAATSTSTRVKAGRRRARAPTPCPPPPTSGEGELRRRPFLNSPSPSIGGGGQGVGAGLESAPRLPIIPRLDLHDAGVRRHDDADRAPAVVGQQQHADGGPAVRRKAQCLECATARGCRRRRAVEV